jgi:hypothetical protein
VVEAIRSRHKRGLPLCSKEKFALKDAARRYFGNWREALLAAGVPVPELRPKWSRERIIAEIQARHRQGLSLSSNDAASLASAARRYFGSWREALAEARLDSKQGGRAERGE